jgi:hypothetical protein
MLRAHRAILPRTSRDRLLPYVEKVRHRAISVDAVKLVRPGDPLGS